MELCIWLVRKLIGLPLLKRTPHQSKAEACYRQITCFLKKLTKVAVQKLWYWGHEAEYILLMRLIKKGLRFEFWFLGVRCLLIAPFVMNPAKMPFFQISLIYINIKLPRIKNLIDSPFLIMWTKVSEKIGSISCIVFAQLGS